MLSRPVAFILGAAVASTGMHGITGCSSDSNDSGGLPANATVFDESNAAGALESAFAIGLLLEIVEVAVVDGIPVFCLNAGTVDDIGGINTVGTNTTYSGTVTADNCELSAGEFVSATLNYSFTRDTMGPETSDITGSLTFTAAGLTATVSAINFKETGNSSVGNYSTNIFSFGYSLSSGGGFTAELTQPLVGVDTEQCPDSGVMLLTGAQNTMTRGTFLDNGVSPSDIIIEVDSGSGFAEIMNSPVVCITLL